MRSGPVASNLGGGGGQLELETLPPATAGDSTSPAGSAFLRLPRTSVGWVATLWLEAER